MFKLFKNFLRLILLILMIGLAVVCYARYIEPHMLQEKYITIKSAQVTDKAENLKVVVFGDTHFSDYYTTA